MSPPTLTPRQRRYLRSLAHALQPTTHVGKEGLSVGVVAAVAQALHDHELVKVKLGDNAGLERNQAAEDLAERTASAVAQVLGNVIVLYRARDERPTIVLP